MKENLKELFEEVEKLEWTVSNESPNEYQLSKLDPRGQEFKFIATGNTEEEIFASIHKSYMVFRQTFVCLDYLGQGKDGVLYKAPHVVEDLLMYSEMIWEIFGALATWEEEKSERVNEEK
jgi:hypothetical protein